MNWDSPDTEDDQDAMDSDLWWYFTVVLVVVVFTASVMAVITVWGWAG